jgi:hypothetical protein
MCLRPQLGRDLERVGSGEEGGKGGREGKRGG